MFFWKIDKYRFGSDYGYPGLKLEKKKRIKNIWYGFSVEKFEEKLLR